MTAEQFKLVLRQTESDNNPRAYGDGGLALTSYQVHPAWVWDQLAKYGPVAMPKIGDSWEQWIGLLVALFFARALGETSSEVEIAMWFHRGHHIGPRDERWDRKYADRFSMFASQLPIGPLVTVGPFNREQS